MSDWLKVNILGLVSLAVVVGGGVYAYGTLNQHVAELTETEARIERQLERLETELQDVRERVVAIETYLRHFTAASRERSNYVR